MRARRSWWARLRRLLFWTLLLLLPLLSVWVVYEMHTSRLQSRLLHRYAGTLGWTVQSGPSPSIQFPREGPFDKRLGYAYLPLLLQRAQERDFIVDAQARFSPALLDFTQRGFYPPYAEKVQAGLDLRDCRGESLHDFAYPQQAYARFADVPWLVVQSLLFIENRRLLDPSRPQANPAVDWPRLAAAVGSQVQKLFDADEQTAGGSTLATQIEKFRHSPDGMTLSFGEKWRQLVSASVRAYRPGRETLPVQRDVVRDYLNLVPLSAAPGHGEVHGIADGLRVWYGADFDEVNRLLDPLRSPEASDADRGRALRQVLSLMIAQRRPSFYLAQGRNELAALTDSHLRLLAREGVISDGLARAALAQKLAFRDWQLEPNLQPIEATKGVSVARARLSSLLKKSLYELDRLDLAASTTLQGDLQAAVSSYLERLADPAFAAEVGLIGHRLLDAAGTGDVRYSFTLFELQPDRFSVRVQTDSTDQLFDINEASKLELGSTAKLRTLVTYLQVIAELHKRFVGETPAALRALELPPEDALTRWAAGWLASNPGAGLQAMLDAAMERRYSANPGERFFTGGGLHTFSNFQKEDNGRNPTVRESLRESINLPFVRIMRDLVRYSTYQTPGSSAGLMRDDSDPRRAEYLSRFADREGRTFLSRFWRRYRGKDAEQQQAVFFDGVQKTPARLAAAHRYLLPDASVEQFAEFMRGQLAERGVPTSAQLAKLYTQYRRGQYSLSDQAYLARVHPLDLWLLGHLLEHPQAGFDDVVAASQDERQEVYSWLFRSRHKAARDSRLRIMLEVEAFLDIHRRWSRLGYPFDHLVPSLATALGSSGDRPAALSELIGIILNDGVRLPTVRIDDLHFAADTPYDTRLVRIGDARRVMRPEVAATLRAALADVVENGTARRLKGSFVLEDGTALVAGGKTGTGDNRIDRVGAGGQRISSRALNRTATLVFFLGPKHFGTLTAFVAGEAAGRFSFTSALPVQALKGMAPILTPYLQPDRHTLCTPGPAERMSQGAGPR